jgi:peptidoglycan/LPS O-acetylase OafA/YrhL
VKQRSDGAAPGIILKRIPQLDGLRAFAFLSIFLYHSVGLPPWLPLWAGVDVFFVLSGFLITGVLLEKKETGSHSFFLDFYKRRARRILPAYYVSLVFIALLFTYDWSRIWYWHVFFLSNFGQAWRRAGGYVLNSLWSLAVEEQFYLFWPFVIFHLRTTALRRWVWLTICFVPVLRALCSRVLTGEQIYLLTPFRLDGLMIGALLAIWYRSDQARFERWGRRAPVVMLVALVCFAWSALDRQFTREADSVYFNTFGYLYIAVFAGALIAYLVNSSGLPVHLFSWQPIAYLGTVSYMMYLIHEPMIQLLVPFGKLHGPLYARVLAFLATVAFASVSWSVLERPLLARRVRRSSTATYPAAQQE